MFIGKKFDYKKIINNPDFNRWFENSVMVKPNGEPIIFYHGSNSDFDVFDYDKIGSSTDAGWLGYGFYFYTDKHESSQYGRVRSFVLNITNPYYATPEDNERLSELNDKDESKKFTQTLISEGYDGVYYNGDLRGETVVFNSNQIVEVIIEENKINMKNLIKEEINKMVQESKKEQIYFKSFSEAINYSLKKVEEQGYKTFKDQVFSELNQHDRARPKVGETKRFTFDLYKGGKKQRKALQVQVYNRGNEFLEPYELNKYIN